MKTGGVLHVTCSAPPVLAMGDSHLVADDDGEATPLVPLHVVLGIAGRKAGRHASAVPGPLWLRLQLQVWLWLQL